MGDKVLKEIISLCMLLDRKAARAYLRVAEMQERKELREFWKEMSREEAEHVKFWRRLLELAGQGAVPEVFDEPGAVLDELKSVEKKLDAMAEHVENFAGDAKPFLLAYRLEYYMLHPAFELLFHIGQCLPGEKALAIDYERHLQNFIDALVRFGASTPEMELLGETISRLWRDNRKLALESTTDSLTGVSNRHGFFRAVRAMAHLSQRSGHTVGILMADIDDFKAVNDNMGHQAGDMVLRSVAGILKSQMRASDMVGRYGGEEFIVFLPQVDPKGLLKLAELLRNVVEVETLNRIPVTVSIGSAHGLLDKDVDASLNLFIAAADDNLYRAKEAGKNRVVAGSI